MTHYAMPSFAKGVLSRSGLRWFWISWLRGTLSYGRGSEPGVEIIGTLVNLSPFSVNYMSVGCYGINRSYFVIPSQLYRSPRTCCSNYDHTTIVSCIGLIHIPHTYVYITPHTVV